MNILSKLLLKIKTEIFFLKLKCLNHKISIPDYRNSIAYQKFLEENPRSLFDF